ncbi:hypothetical protein MASR1M65_29840 [Saprospiraceae bacterium]
MLPFRLDPGTLGMLSADITREIQAAVIALSYGKNTANRTSVWVYHKSSAPISSCRHSPHGRHSHIINTTPRVLIFCLLKLLPSPTPT